MPGPSPASHTNLLTGVAAVGASAVWAVGWQYGTGPRNEGLILHWDGNGWSVSPNPNPSTGPPSLAGVEAVAANEGWAVGSAYAPLIQRYHDSCRL